MSYTIKLTNGTVFAIVPDGTINTNSSMTLIGKNYAGYGQFLDDNFIHLLESGSNDSPPPNPLIGQLWWDSANKVLKVYTGTNFRSIASNIASTTPPPNPVAGDMWFNTANNTLNVYSGSTWVTIGPSVINGTGTIPAIIEDTFGINHSVVEVLIGSTIVGIVSKDPAFTPLVAIPGFISVGPGYNVASSVAGVNQFFQGTATNALNLDGYDSTAFMSAIQDTTTVGEVGILNNGGLTTGQQQNFSFFNIVNDGIIQNRTVNGNIIISLNIGGNQVDVANYYGANGNVKFFNDVTSNTVHANTIYGDGGNITNINYSNVTGAYGNANVANFLASGTLTSNVRTSAYFVGDGGYLSNISPANITPGPGVVRVVNTGTGLTGGPIVNTGTISLLKSVSANAGVGGTIGGVIPDGYTIQMNSSGVITAVAGAIGQPTISGFSPISGPVAGGTIVVITGTYFSGATSVTIAGVPVAHYSITSGTQIVAVTAPSSTATSGVISVTTPGGTTSSVSSFAYVNVPSITSFSPISSPIAGGQIVSINGTNFTGASSVTLAGIAASSFVVHSSTLITAITATTPAEVIGPIKVTTPSGTATSSEVFGYTNVPKAPTITSISPSVGPTSGGTNVTINGTGFTGALLVFVNGIVAASFNAVSDTQIQCVTAPGPAGSGEIQVLTIHGTATSTQHFTYQTSSATPTISFITPFAGPLSGGTSVTIAGTNLGAATSVTIAGVAATFSITSPTQIVAVTGAKSTAGAGPVVITSPTGTVTSSMAFTYYNTPDEPNIYSFAPRIAALGGGTQVSIVGQNFETSLGAPAISTVLLAGIAAAHISVQDDGNLTAVTTATPSATSGFVTVSGIFGSATSMQVFTYAAIPQITSFSPTTGPVSGNTPVVVVGTNFAGVTAATVAGAVAPAPTVVSNGIIELTTPPNSAGTGLITVTNVDGTGTSTQTFTYSSTGFGTVTSVGVGTGLVSSTGASPITTSGTISLAKSVAAVGGIGGTIGGVIPDGTTITMNGNGMISAVTTSPYSNANVSSFLASGSLTTNIVTTANATAAFFIGNGSQLTNLPLGNYSNANVAAYLPTYNGAVGGSIQIGSLGVGGGASGTVGEIRATNNITAFYSSDERLKENFVKIDQPLDKAKAIRGYFFDWSEQYIEDRGGEDGFFVRKHDVGVKAQEVQKVMPEVVAERQDGYLGVRYEMLIPLLFECINTLVERIEKLENK